MNGDTMYILRLFLATLSFLLLISADMAAQTLESHYPLAVTTEWTFTSIAGAYTETVLSSEVDMHGNTWYLLSSFRGIDSMYVRIDQTGDMLLKKNGVETLWITFGATVGDSWTGSLPGGDSFTVTLQADNDTLTVPYGFFTNVFRFYFSWAGADNDLAEYYVDNIGPVQRILYGFGVMTDRLSDFSTVTQTESIPSMPVGFVLGEPYPNPGCTVVRIPVVVSSSRNRNIAYAVYDMLGRIVREPVTVWLYQGHDITVERGGLPRGHYLVRVEHAGRMQSILIYFGE